VVSPVYESFFILKNNRNSKNVQKNDIFPFHQVFSVKMATHKLKRPPSNTRMDLCASFKKNLVLVSSILSDIRSISGDTILRIKGSGKYRCRDRKSTNMCDQPGEVGRREAKRSAKKTWKHVEYFLSLVHIAYYLLNMF